MMNIELKLKDSTLQIPLPEGVAPDPKLLDGGHPLYYLLKQPGATTNYLNQVCDLLRDVPKGLKVIEFCGGIGLIPAALKPVIEWDKWATIELDPSCEKAYLLPEVNFYLGDMYDPKWNLANYDMVFMDFPSNTLPKMWREGKRADLLLRVAEAKPRYWEITDVGYYWIHLANHWPIYEKRFGVKPTRENYHQLFDGYMRETYGYKVINWTVGGGAQYFLMEAV